LIKRGITHMQLTAFSVTPPAEHAARRPAGAADAAEADAEGRFAELPGLDKFDGMIYCNT
jgi:hypothetical protein